MRGFSCRKKKRLGGNGADKAKQALAQIVRQVELEEKSDQLRVHLSIAELAPDTHKEKAAEETSAASFAVFTPSSEIFGAKAGNFGVPTGIRTPVLTVKG